MDEEDSGAGSEDPPSGEAADTEAPAMFRDCRWDGDPPSCGTSAFAEASASAEASADKSADKGQRIHPNKHRALQVARTGGRKLFDDARKAVFLDWFAATCNVSWAAEQAGVNYRTVWKHRMNDPAFAEGCDRAEEQGVARLRAKRLETKRRPLAIGPDGEADAPEMDDIDPELVSLLLREHDRGPGAGRSRKRGRPPRVATNAEVRAALVARLAAFGVRVFGEPPSRDASAAGASPGASAAGASPGASAAGASPDASAAGGEQ